MPQNIRKSTDSDELDRIDRALVSLLQQNARLSNKQLAARVGLAESSTLVRVRRLEERGVLRGYHAEVAPWALGIHLQALVAVRLVRHSKDVVDNFREHCRVLPQVLATYHIGGTDDYLVHVGVTDTQALREFILASISTRPEVTHIETHLIFDMVRGAASLGPGPEPARTGARRTGRGSGAER